MQLKGDKGERGEKGDKGEKEKKAIRVTKVYRENVESKDFQAMMVRKETKVILV